MFDKNKDPLDLVDVFAKRLALDEAEVFSPSYPPRKIPAEARGARKSVRRREEVPTDLRFDTHFRGARHVDIFASTVVEVDEDGMLDKLMGRGPEEEDWYEESNTAPLTAEEASWLIQPFRTHKESAAITIALIPKF